MKNFALPHVVWWSQEAYVIPFPFILTNWTKLSPMNDAWTPNALVTVEISIKWIGMASQKEVVDFHAIIDAIVDMTSKAHH